MCKTSDIISVDYVKTRSKRDYLVFVTRVEEVMTWSKLKSAHMSIKRFDSAEVGFNKRHVPDQEMLGKLK